MNTSSQGESKEVVLLPFRGKIIKTERQLELFAVETFPISVSVMTCVCFTVVNGDEVQGSKPRTLV